MPGIYDVSVQTASGETKTLAEYWAKKLSRWSMFESQYNDEMEAEVKRLEAQMRAINAGHPEWINACSVCGGELTGTAVTRCEKCL